MLIYADIEFMMGRSAICRRRGGAEMPVYSPAVGGGRQWVNPIPEYIRIARAGEAGRRSGPLRYTMAVAIVCLRPQVELYRLDEVRR